MKNIFKPVKLNFAIILLLVLTGGFSLLFSLPGDFVKDIKIKELNFNFPEINKEKPAENITSYSIYSDRLPMVYAEINLYSGEKSLAEKPIEIAALAAEVLKLGGSKNYPDDTLSARLEYLGATFSISSDYDRFTLAVNYLSRDEEEVWTVLKDLIDNPTYSEATLANAKRKMIEQIKKRNERTENIAFRKAKELFYKGFLAGKSYQIQSVESVTAEDIKEFWVDSLENHRKSIVLTGNYTDKKLPQKIASLLRPGTEKKSKLKKENINEDILSENLGKFKSKNLFVSREVSQSMVLMMGVLPEHKHPDFYAIQLLNYIIGGSGFNSYLMQKIRVEKGLAYTSTSYPVFKADHGSLYFYTMTKNDSLQQVHDLMQEILSEKTINKITNEELENAKNAINNQFVFLFLNNYRILTNQLRFDEDGMPDKYLQNYRTKIKSVTLDDIARVGKKYFIFDSLKTIIVSNPESLKKFKGEGITIQPEELLPAE